MLSKGCSTVYKVDRHQQTLYCIIVYIYREIERDAASVDEHIAAYVGIYKFKDENRLNDMSHYIHVERDVCVRQVVSPMRLFPGNDTTSVYGVHWINYQSIPFDI